MDSSVFHFFLSYSLLYRPRFGAGLSALSSVSSLSPPAPPPSSSEEESRVRSTTAPPPDAAGPPAIPTEPLPDLPVRLVLLWAGEWPFASGMPAHIGAKLTQIA
ncbi:hypothetical protein EYF80_014771 [Liparis tanakae]|uniref:Uncharacterized protein n=1 Tax=Liparis tanakae TaxID=230148 RepID=A0A4Z2IC43_9TELE|nr:hypothetical protein EYF80_014771 [Liparis tanakae]